MRNRQRVRQRLSPRPGHPTPASQNETPPPGMAGASSRSTASAAHAMFEEQPCSVSALSFQIQGELHDRFIRPSTWMNSRLPGRANCAVRHQITKSALTRTIRTPRVGGRMRTRPVTACATRTRRLESDHRRRLFISWSACKQFDPAPATPKAPPSPSGDGLERISRNGGGAS